MARKRIKYGIEARTDLKNGVDKLARAVVVTLGPKGRNTAIARDWKAPLVVHDGVTVAKEVILEDPFEDMGAQMVREAASKTNDVAGDGTTTATLLAQSIVEQGFEHLKDESVNPMIIKQGMEKAMHAVVAEIKSMAKEVKGKDIEKVATISAQNPEIGRIVAEAITKVGKDGLVTTEEGSQLETTVEYKEGMEFDQGYVSAYFVDNKEKMTCELKKPLVLLTDINLTHLDPILPFLEAVGRERRSLLIIAPEIEGEALTALVLNKIRGNLDVVAVKTPGFGDRRTAILEDLAILTGGNVISEGMGKTLSTATIEDCGNVDKVWISDSATKIIGGKGDKKKLEERIAQIRTLIASTTSDFDREKLQERLSKLTNGAAIINIGAVSEIEMDEKKERVIDAISATKAAIEDGIVPGGGVTLLRASNVIASVDLEDKDEKIGAEILFNALGEPARRLIKNAGLKEEVFIKVVSEKGDFGYNVLTGKFGSMIAEGIIDPAKVTCSAVTNAVSVATMILTTECLISDVPQEEKK